MEKKIKESLEKKLWIHVTTGSQKQKVRKSKTETGRLEVKLKSQPVKGKANKELKEVLSEFFGVPMNYIEILKGARSKNKLINVKYYTKK